MSTMLTEVYDAFRAVGVPEEQARAAATALTAHAENGWRRDLDTWRRQVDSQLAVLRWMTGYLVAVTTVILWRVFTL